MFRVDKVVSSVAAVVYYTSVHLNLVYHMPLVVGAQEASVDGRQVAVAQCDGLYVTIGEVHEVAVVGFDNEPLHNNSASGYRRIASAELYSEHHFGSFCSLQGDSLAVWKIDVSGVCSLFHEQNVTVFCSFIRCLERRRVYIYVCGAAYQRHKQK